jgi:hypothetical protein
MIIKAIFWRCIGGCGMGLATVLSATYPLKAQIVKAPIIPTDSLAEPLLAPENLIGHSSLSTPTITELENLRKSPATLSQPEAPHRKPPFSPTTKLEGEALFSGIAVGSQELDTGYRVRLTFDTSFTGRDQLRVRLQAANTPRPDQIADTDLARLAFQGSSNGQFELSRLEYRFPLSKNTTAYLEVVGGSLNDVTDTLNPYLSGSARGSLSRFGQRNPIYRQGEGMGVGLTHELSKELSVSAGYLTSSGTDPLATAADTSYGAIAQLTYKPTKFFGVGLAYVYSYNALDTSTGSAIANDPFDDESESIHAHSLGIQASLKVNSYLSLSSWVGFTHATATDLPGNPQASILNWAVTAAFPDLGQKGNLGALLIGQPPQAISNEFDGTAIDRGNSLHLEALYRIQVQKNIAITLGGWIVTHPEQGSDQSPVFVGAVRTTFSF